MKKLIISLALAAFAVASSNCVAAARTTRASARAAAAGSSPALPPVPPVQPAASSVLPNQVVEQQAQIPDAGATATRTAVTGMSFKTKAILGALASTCVAVVARSAQTCLNMPANFTDSAVCPVAWYGSIAIAGSAALLWLVNKIRS